MLISSDEEKREFLAWVGPVQDFERYESCRACRTQGTCSWILEQESFVEWKSSSFPNGFPKFLWIHGPAGYGKSVICAAVVEDIQQDDASRLAHHFVASSAHYQEDITVVLRSWIAQMITANDHLLDTALEEVHQAPLGAVKSSLWKLFTSLVQASTDWTYVLDGLDEFQTLHDRQKQDSREDRVQFLADLQMAVMGTRSRVLIVSRDELDIRQCLGAAEAYANGPSLYEHQISIADVEWDILAFSRSVVATKLANKSDSIRDEIAERMAVKCEGMFLWIDLHRRDLRAGKNRRQLQQTIEEMPAGLDSVYERNWNDISRLTGSDKSRALSILRWVTFAARPLTVAEMTEALLVSDDDGPACLRIDDLPDCIDDEYIASEISGLCGSLVEVSSTGPDQPPELQTIHLRHFSVRQFLLTKNAQIELSDTGFDASSSFQTENNNLAIICLRYLRDDNVQEDLRLQKETRPFVDYAVRFWHRHVSQLGERYESLSQIATDFFASDMPDWELWRSRFHHLWNLEHPEEEPDGKENPSPMYYAAFFGLEETIERLHSKRPDSIDTVGGVHGTPIKAAYAAGHSQIAMRLAGLGADLNISAGCHGSLLGSACNRGDLELCKFLLDKDISLLAVDEMHRTPLYIACLNGHTDVLKLLLEHKADVSTANINGWTPINAASADGHVEVVKQLLEYHADLSVVNCVGQTPLCSACLDGHVEIVKLLLEHKADTSVITKSGLTSIIAASENGHIEVVKLLLEYQADVSIADNDGWTPLYAASVNRHIRIVKLLLEYKAETSIINKCGWTPIKEASNSGHIDVLK